MSVVGIKDTEQDDDVMSKMCNAFVLVNLTEAKWLRDPSHYHLPDSSASYNLRVSCHSSSSLFCLIVARLYHVQQVHQVLALKLRVCCRQLSYYKCTSY